MKTIIIKEVHYVEVEDELTTEQVLEQIEQGELLLDENSFDIWEIEEV